MLGEGEGAGRIDVHRRRPRGPARLQARWDGEVASRIKAVLETAAEKYPHCHAYFPWPGPNSNTFVAWVLREAGLPVDLAWKALGKDYGWRAA